MKFVYPHHHLEVMAIYSRSLLASVGGQEAGKGGVGTAVTSLLLPGKK